MKYHTLFNTYDPENSRFLTLPDRKATIALLAEKPVDILVIGGGIHAATAARIAVLNGLRTALLERDDFDQEICVPSTHRPFLQKVLSIFRSHKVEAISEVTDCTRTVIETILSARQEGALCLNHAEVVLTRHDATNAVTVSWVDSLTGQKHELKAWAVLNCAGQWVSMVGRISPAEFHRSIEFIRTSYVSCYTGDGVHKLIKGPSKRVSGPERDPKPTHDEVREILEHVPGISPHYVFTRMRVQSSSDPWFYSQGAYNFLGGSTGTAAHDSFEGLRLLVSKGGNKISLSEMNERLLPGSSGNVAAAIESFRSVSVQNGIPSQVVERIISRYGGRVRFFEQHEECMTVIQNRFLKGEILISIFEECACTLHDMIRRLNLEFEKDFGVPLLDSIGEVMFEYLPSLEYEAEKEEYVQRITNLNLKSL